MLLTAFFSRHRHRPAHTESECDDVPQPDAGAPNLSWCRVALSVTMVPPKYSGQVFSIEQGPRTRRVVIYAPRGVLLALTGAFLGSVPWIRDLTVWCATHLKF